MVTGPVLVNITVVVAVVMVLAMINPYDLSRFFVPSTIDSQWAIIYSNYV